MLKFFDSLPGMSDVHQITRRIDTVYHRGVAEGCILELDLQTLPPETQTFNPLTLINPQTRKPALHSVIEGLYRARDDRRVAGLIARIQLHAPLAGPIQELRQALIDFSLVKPSLAWAETYPGTLSYYLASACREVWMHPSGTVELIGFAAHATFLKEALDQLGVQPQFVTRGEYKTAANLFTESGYTPAHKHADTALVTSLSQQVREAVMQSRNLDASTVEHLMDSSPLLRQQALDSGLVDTIGFTDEAYRRIAILTGSPEEIDLDSPKAPQHIGLSRYIHASDGGVFAGIPSISARHSKPTIAIVNVVGPIVSGQGKLPFLPLAGKAVGADVIAACLHEVTKNNDVVGIVLRVNSPGGSVSGSETIWRAVCRARDAGKPVVASMGAVAASGGYYICAPATKIIANPGTITGSIGVLAGKLVIHKLKDRLGIGYDVIRTNPNADIWSANTAFNQEQQDHLNAQADLFYEDFLQRVARGRDLSVEAVDQVGRGRVWTGADALDCGLVDQLGGLRQALTVVKTLAGFDEDTPVHTISYPGTSMWDFFHPKPSSQPAGSLSSLVSEQVFTQMKDLISDFHHANTGLQALWLGYWDM